MIVRIFIFILTTGLAFLIACDILENQTQSDTSGIPWDKLTGKISFVNQDEGKYATKKHLYIIDAQNRSLKEVKSSSDIYFTDAIISSRGDQIAYNVSNGLEVLNLNNGYVVSYQNSYRASFTRNNELVYYYLNSIVKEVRLNGKKMTLPLLPSSRIAYGPNDKFIVYCVSASNGGTQLIKFNLLDSTYQTIGGHLLGDTVTHANNPDISHNGQLVVYSKSFNNARRWVEIWLTNIDGSNDHKLVSANNVNYDFPMWSPDDKYILFSSDYSYDGFYGGYDVSRRMWIFDVVKGTKNIIS